MLNYMKADFYRMSSRPAMWIWSIVLAVFPSLAIWGASSQYEAEKALGVTPVGIYILFMFAVLMLSEYTFREDKQLGLFKNDTTGGISRSGLYVSKYLSGVIAAAALWAVCSALSALTFVKAYDVPFPTALSALFSVRAFGWILQNGMYLALFQIIGIYVKKTSVLLLVCLAFSTAISNIGNMIAPVMPKLTALFQTIFGQGASDNAVLQNVITLVLPLAGIMILISAGCVLFKKSEL